MRFADPPPPWRRSGYPDSLRYAVHGNTKKTHCPLGHSLTDPNLTQAGKRRGRRDCLACCRARAVLVGRRRLGHTDVYDLQAIADSYYQVLMEDSDG